MVLKRVRIRHCRYCYSRRPLESVTCLFMPSSLMVTLRVMISIIFLSAMHEFKLVVCVSRVLPGPSLRRSADRSNVAHAYRLHFR